MKKFIVVCSILGIIACNSSNTAPAKAEPAEKAMDPEAKKGLDLIAKDDCFGCHKVADQLRGPSYEMVAERYKDSSAAITDTLAQRIIRGSMGHWTNGDAMTPHPALSADDARLMAKYVLSLKK